MARRVATRSLGTEPIPAVTQFPYRFAPRSYQLPVLQAWESGLKRLVIVWPRRHGKDLTALAVTQKSIIRRPGLYWHIYPTLKQGRKSMWDGQDFSGVPFRDRWPRHLMTGEPNDTEMKIDLKPLGNQPAGSSWQVMGADDPSSLRGPNPVGVVFSEFQLHDPLVWGRVISPILRENKGWALFDFTPEGEDHAYELFKLAQSSSSWFAQLITSEQTRRNAPGEDGSPVISMEEIAEEEAELARLYGPQEAHEIVQREYFCSFKGRIRGSIFGDLVAQAEAETRVEFAPWDPLLPVGTAWDIGRNMTAIWFWQEKGQAIDLIEYVEESGKDMAHWAHLLKERRTYQYGEHLFPHDIKVTEWTSTETRLQKAENMGLKPAYVAEKLPIGDSIDATRILFHRMRFDAGKCARGLETLRAYKYEFDEEHRRFTKEPVNDWASHGASALRTLAVAYRAGRIGSQGQAPVELKVETAFDPFARYIPLSGRRL